MSPYQYSLKKNEYTVFNALSWQLFVGHCEKASNETYWGDRVVHALIAAAETIPVISQIASLIEYIIVTYFSGSAQKPNSSSENKDPVFDEPPPSAGGSDGSSNPCRGMIPAKPTSLTRSVQNVANEHGLGGVDLEEGGSGELLLREEARQLVISQTVEALEESFLDYLVSQGLEARDTEGLVFNGWEILEWARKSIRQLMLAGTINEEEAAALLSRVEGNGEEGAIVVRATYDIVQLRAILRQIAEMLTPKTSEQAPSLHLRDEAQGPGTIAQQLGLAPRGKKPLRSRISSTQVCGRFGMTSFDGLVLSCPLARYCVDSSLLLSDKHKLLICNVRALPKKSEDSSISIITSDQGILINLTRSRRSLEEKNIVPDIFERGKIGSRRGPWIDKRVAEDMPGGVLRPWDEKKEEFETFFREMDALSENETNLAHYLIPDVKAILTLEHHQKAMNPRIMLMIYFIDVKLRKGQTAIDIEEMINKARQMTADIMPITGDYEALLEDYLKYRGGVVPRRTNSLHTVPSSVGSIRSSAAPTPPSAAPTPPSAAPRSSGARTAPAGSSSKVHKKPNSSPRWR